MILIDGINGNKLNIEKPRRGKNWIDFDDDEKIKIEKWLLNLKTNVLKNFGALNYDDCSFFANLYLTEFSKIKTLIQKRF